jgi:hypothetical protein
MLHFLLTSVGCGHALVTPRHYVFFGRERERIHQSTFLQTKTLEGAQLKYMWRELEPEKGRYDFSEIQKDLTFLKAHRKKLFLQLQDATFAAAFYGVPDYLRSDPRYHGGVAPQYNLPGGNDDHPIVAGWVARRWDKPVQVRFQSLLTALGKEFDGRIEGINFAETAVDFGASGRLYPKGFTPKGYQDAVIANMKALKRAFPRSVTMQYANFMPGEWLPGDDHFYLRTVYRQAAQLGVGVGGPDLLPLRPGQMAHAYPLLRQYSGRVPTGIAVQEGNYEEKNPKTGQRYSVAELLRFAQEYLKVTYVFWGTQEPYYSQELIPFLKGQGQ